MNAEDLKVWQINEGADSLRITFFGKFADGLKMLTLSLLALLLLFLLGLVLMLIATESSSTLITIDVVVILILTIILFLNWRTSITNHEVEIKNGKVILKKIRGKNIQKCELALADIVDIKLHNRKTDDTTDIILLLISPVLWFVVGAGKGQSRPAFYTKDDGFGFFEFGSETHQLFIVGYLKRYLNDIRATDQPPIP